VKEVVRDGNFHLYPILRRMTSIVGKPFRRAPFLTHLHVLGTLRIGWFARSNKQSIPQSVLAIHERAGRLACDTFFTEGTSCLSQISNLNL
jgi:hypothetical protein